MSLRLVVADHGRLVGLAVADVGDADRGRAVDHVVVGEDLAVGRQHDAGALGRRVLVAEGGGDVHDAPGRPGWRSATWTALPSRSTSRSTRMDDPCDSPTAAPAPTPAATTAVAVSPSSVRPRCRRGGSGVGYCPYWPYCPYGYCANGSLIGPATPNPVRSPVPSYTRRIAGKPWRTPKGPSGGPACYLKISSSDLQLRPEPGAGGVRPAPGGRPRPRRTGASAACAKPPLRNRRALGPIVPRPRPAAPAPPARAAGCAAPRCRSVELPRDRRQAATPAPRAARAGRGLPRRPGPPPPRPRHRARRSPLRRPAARPQRRGARRRAPRPRRLRGPADRHRPRRASTRSCGSTRRCWATTWPAACSSSTELREHTWNPLLANPGQAHLPAAGPGLRAAAGPAARAGRAAGRGSRPGWPRPAPPSARCRRCTWRPRSAQFDGTDRPGHRGGQRRPEPGQRPARRSRGGGRGGAGPARRAGGPGRAPRLAGGPARGGRAGGRRARVRRRVRRPAPRPGAVLAASCP